MGYYERLSKKTDDTVENVIRQRKAVQFFLRDWKRIKRTDQEGKETSHWVYAGSYFVRKISEKKLIRRKWLYLADYLASASLFVLSSLMDTEANERWYVIAPQVVGLIAMSMLLISVVSYMWTPARMKSHEYLDASLLLRLFALVSAGCGSILLLENVCLLFYGLYSLRQVLSVGIYGLITVLLICMWRTERCTEYLIEISP